MVFSVRTIALAAVSTAALSGVALAADANPAAPGCPAPGSKDAVAYIKNPKWIRQPNGDDVTKVYPPFAYREHKSDHTVVDCAVGDDGGLQDCTLLEDKRPRQGFDKATVSLTRLYRMSPLAEQPAYTGLPECVRKLGAPHVVIPMNWFAGG